MKIATSSRCIRYEVVVSRALSALSRQAICLFAWSLALLVTLASPASAQTQLTLGTPLGFTEPAPNDIGWILYTSSTGRGGGFRVNIPGGASALSISLTGLSGAQGWRLYARIGADVGVGGGTIDTVTADYSGGTSIQVSSPPSGAYYIAIAAFSLTPSARPSGTIVATASGPPAKLSIISGNNQTGVPGSALANPLVVQVKDTFGNPSANVVVNFTGSNATVNPGGATTDSLGMASTRVTLGSSTGPVSITAGATGLTAVTFAATAATVPTTLSIVSGDNQTATLGSALANPLVVQVKDSLGNPAPNVAVTFAATNSATANPGSTSTDVSGLASSRISLGSSTGPVSIVASVNGLPNVTFAAVALAPAPLTTTTVAGIQDGPVSAESIVTSNASHLATDTASADVDQPPTTLAGTTVTIADSNATSRAAVLFSVSPKQVTYEIPAGVADGAATVTVTAADGVVTTGPLQIAHVSPGVYSLNPAGLVKAYVMRVSNGNVFIEDVYKIDSTGAVIARPVTISNGDQIQLIAYGTGFRAAGTVGVSVTIGGENVKVNYAGPQGVAPGVDQFTILIPPGLPPGVVRIVLTAEGQAANTVTMAVQ